MSTKVTINGNVYSMPNPGQEAGWGEDTTNIILDLIEVVTSLTGTGSISESSAALLNNQSTFADIPSLVFSSSLNLAVVVSYVIDVNATTKQVEQGTLSLRYDKQNSAWKITREYTGDDTGVTIDVTAGGQVQYKTPSFPGFVSCTIKFKTGQSVIEA